MTPFASGYMAAIRADLGVADDAPFSDEALALILRDCEAYPPGFDPDRSAHDQGADLWADLRKLRAPYLSDDGRVCLRESR